MKVHPVFQEILNAHYPPRWVRELDEIPGPPPVDMTDAEYNPYVKEGECDGDDLCARGPAV